MGCDVLLTESPETLLKYYTQVVFKCNILVVQNQTHGGLMTTTLSELLVCLFGITMEWEENGLLTVTSVLLCVLLLLWLLRCSSHISGE